MSTSRNLRERAALCMVTAMWDERATDSSMGTAELAEQVELLAGVQARILGPSKRDGAVSCPMKPMPSPTDGRAHVLRGGG